MGTGVGSRLVRSIVSPPATTSISVGEFVLESEPNKSLTWIEFVKFSRCNQELGMIVVAERLAVLIGVHVSVAVANVGVGWVQVLVGLLAVPLIVGTRDALGVEDALRVVGEDWLGVGAAEGDNNAE